MRDPAGDDVDQYVLAMPRELRGSGACQVLRERGKGFLTGCRQFDLRLRDGLPREGFETPF